MELIHLIAAFIISLGAFFLLIGSIGLIRLPDFFSRTHATGKSDTLGIMLIIFGLVLAQWGADSSFLTKFVNSAKLLIIIVFVALTNPTATNALSKAALKFRLVPWFKQDKEKSGKSKDKEKE
jgi:multicomponent Na+:H+ antiporter subunit G